MKKICLSLVASFLIFTLKAQVTNEEKAFKLKDVCMIFGVTDANHGVISSSKFLNLAAGSGIDLSQYRNISISNHYTVASVSALTAFSAGKNDDNDFFEGPVIRVGITGWGNAESAMTLKNSEQTGRDTLTSAATGQQVLIDTSMRRSVNIVYSNSGVMLDASILFSTDKEKRWKFYAGAGVGSGVTVDAHTTVYSSLTEMITIKPVHGGNNYYDPHSELLEARDEVYRNKSTFVWSLYIPAAIEFTIGRKRPFWKRMNLFYELRPGIGNTSIAEFSQQISSFFNQGIGIKMQLSNNEND